MFDRLISKVLSFLPQKAGDLYYKHESVLLYIFFGGLTTIVSVGTQYLSAYLGANTVLATTISWICAVTFAFFTNKACVFKSKTDTKSEFFKQAGQFFGARLVSYGLELAFMMITVDILLFNMHIMKIIAQIFILTINYLFSKLVIFKKKSNTSNQNQ